MCTKTIFFDNARDDVREMTSFICKVDGDYDDDLVSSHVLHPKQDHDQDNNRDNNFSKSYNNYNENLMTMV